MQHTATVRAWYAVRKCRRARSNSPRPDFGALSVIRAELGPLGGVDRASNEAMRPYFGPPVDSYALRTLSGGVDVREATRRARTLARCRLYVRSARPSEVSTVRETLRRDRIFPLVVVCTLYSCSTVVSKVPGATHRDRTRVVRRPEVSTCAKQHAAPGLWRAVCYTCGARAPRR